MSIIYSGPALIERPRAVAPRPLASLVIRTYNEAQYLDYVLSQVTVQVIPGARPIEVVLVDSGSTDGTLEIATRHGAIVKKIRKEEFTFGRSLNIGCEAAAGEILVLVSGHCIPQDEDWLSELLKPFRDPSVAVTYGRQVGDAASRFSEARVFEKYYPAGPASQGSAFCNNANSAVRKSIWRRFRFDESLTGLEDIDLGRKVVAAGFRIDYCPQSIVIHIHHESWPQVRRRYEREAIALRHIHPELHLTLWEAAMCFVSALWKDFQALLREKRNFLLLGEILHYRFNQFTGSWLGNSPHRELSAREKARYFFPA
jgi:glycosyltransferase involved in cell wall biosynthesis